MAIKPSAAAEIRSLIQALIGPDDVRREVAIARLAVIGSRAVDRLAATYSNTTREARIGILRVLEAIGDARGVPVARHALTESGDVAIAAIAVLRAVLESRHEPAATEALDALLAIALGATAGRRVRLSAFEALEAAPNGLRARVANALENDPDGGLPVAASHDAGEAIWRDALEGQLPDAPRVLRDAVVAKAQWASLTSLQKLVDTLKARESAPSPTGRAEWQAVRGSIHQVLALRGSRVALYDLRESLAGVPGPLPVSFLAALHVIGDCSCLEPLAAAYSRTPVTDQLRRHQLASAFRAIRAREKLTRRHTTLKRIAARWPDAAPALVAGRA